MKNNNENIKKINQETVFLCGKKRQIKYLGEKKHFDTLIDELFKREDYKYGLDKKNDTILDIGGYIGLSAMYFSQHAKNVYVLEPSMSYDLMAENTKGFDKIHPFRLGLADTDGERLLYCAGEDNVAVTMLPFTLQANSIKIQTIRLDTFMRENNIEHVDLMKMDIEGGEYEVFEGDGFRNVAHKIDRIVLEAHPYLSSVLDSGNVWKIPYLLRRVGFEVTTLPATARVLLKHTNGIRKWNDMPVFLAKRK